MRNDPMPWQLTVGQLREALRDAPDEAVVALRVPASWSGPSAVVETLHNLRIEYRGGAVVTFVPHDATPTTAAGG